MQFTSYMRTRCAVNQDRCIWFDSQSWSHNESRMLSQNHVIEGKEYFNFINIEET